MEFILIVISFVILFCFLILGIYIFDKATNNIDKIYIAVPVMILFGVGSCFLGLLQFVLCIIYIFDGNIC